LLIELSAWRVRFLLGIQSRPAPCCEIQLTKKHKTTDFGPQLSFFPPLRPSDWKLFFSAPDTPVFSVRKSAFFYSFFGLYTPDFSAVLVK